MSPIHLKYLGNMSVRSSMSVSIVINEDLWGLVACHGYGDVGIKVTLPIRELCRNIGDCAATNIERLIMLERILARKPPTIAPPTQSPAGFIAASSADLLRVFGADFGMLSIQDEARAIGRLDPYREALVILSHLQKSRFVSIFTSQNINEDFPEIDAKYPPGIRTIAGLLLIPLSIGGSDFLVFFRKCQLREINWAGNPYEKLRRPGSDYLQPRTSFRRWTETVKGMSKEWTDDQMETAAVLGLLYGKFIEIWRQKEAAGNNNRMTRLLLRNSSHEVRTPLNAIVNYLEIALENQLDDSTREILTKAHRASRSLIYVIDDLLNLTKAEEGPVSSVDEIFDLGATVSEVITAFRKEAIRKNLDLTVSTHQGIPETVKGDGARLRQVISNVTSNAFQHSTEGGIKVDIRPLHRWARSSVISITVQDFGVGMSESQLDDLFQDFEQVVDDDERVMSDTSTPSITTQEIGKPLGVGLAVVARYVRNMKGQIRILSEPGKGTIFCLELPFEHADPPPLEPAMVLPSYPRLPSSRSISDPGSSATATYFGPRGGSEPGTNPSLHDPPTPESQPSQAVSASGTTPGDTALASLDDEYPFPRIASQRDLAHRGKLSILIAEDNPINARLLTRRLVKLGYEVEVAQDGQECHDIFISKPNKIDAILMDIQMPLVDGVLSTKMIRAYEGEVQQPAGIHRRVPVIAVSASLREDNRFDYVQSG
jgi:light-regulated signal transduction histidine kinase (bacteriophytochrome)/CheY-like chemotaxis protein